MRLALVEIGAGQQRRLGRTAAHDHPRFRAQIRQRSIDRPCALPIELCDRLLPHRTKRRRPLLCDRDASVV